MRQPPFPSTDLFLALEDNTSRRLPNQLGLGRDNVGRGRDSEMKNISELFFFLVPLDLLRVFSNIGMVLLLYVLSTT